MLLYLKIGGIKNFSIFEKKMRGSEAVINDGAKRMKKGLQ
jgi:hypothetical protein